MKVKTFVLFNSSVKFIGNYSADIQGVIKKKSVIVNAAAQWHPKQRQGSSIWEQHVDP